MKYVLTNIKKKNVYYMHMRTNSANDCVSKNDCRNRTERYCMLSNLGNTQ